MKIDKQTTQTKVTITLDCEDLATLLKKEGYDVPYDADINAHELCEDGEHLCSADLVNGYIEITYTIDHEIAKENTG